VEAVMSETWDYRVVVRNHVEGEEEMLIKMGTDGWELCSVRAVNVGGMIGGVADHFYFKRRRQVVNMFEGIKG
jgi:hypothetical protein